LELPIITATIVLATCRGWALLAGNKKPTRENNKNEEAKQGHFGIKMQ
jgi:hypothetical protein